MSRKQTLAVGLVTISIVALSIGIAAAQSGSIPGMYVFPKRNQPPEQQQAGLQEYHRAFSACMDARGYSVK